MKNIQLVLAVCVLLASCKAKTSDVSSDFIIPEHLKDCSFTLLQSGDGSGITVVRCPNSVTSTRSGKTRNVVIDGVEYQKVEK